MKKVELILTGISDMAEYGREDYRQYDITLDGEIIGAISIVDKIDIEEDDPENDIAYVDRIDIWEEYRSHGYGSIVLEDILHDELGYWKVVVAPDNEDAKRLYKRLGEELMPYMRDMLHCDFEYNNQGFGVYVI